MNSTNIQRFIKTLTGEFSNKEQAQKSPKDYAHINIYVRQLPDILFNGPSFYSEQSFNYDPWRPYRQSVQRLYLKEDTYILENYKIKNQERIAGAGFNIELLKGITKNMLELREGCEMHFVEYKRGVYIGKIEPGKKCQTKRNGKITYITSKVTVDKESWTSIDEGFEIKSNIKIWGAENGAMKFKKISSFNKI